MFLSLTEKLKSEVFSRETLRPHVCSSFPWHKLVDHTIAGEIKKHKKELIPAYTFNYIHIWKLYTTKAKLEFWLI